MNCGQLRNRNERIGLVRALLQLVDRGECALHRSRVQVVHQHNIAVACLLHDDLLYVLSIAVLPVLGVHAPVDDRQARLLGDRLDRIVDAAADRAEQRRQTAGLFLDKFAVGVDLHIDFLAAEAGQA